MPDSSGCSVGWTVYTSSILYITTTLIFPFMIIVYNSTATFNYLFILVRTFYIYTLNSTCTYNYLFIIYLFVCLPV